MWNQQDTSLMFLSLEKLSPASSHQWDWSSFPFLSMPSGHGLHLQQHRDPNGILPQSTAGTHQGALRQGMDSCPCLTKVGPPSDPFCPKSVSLPIAPLRTQESYSL